MWAIFPRPSPRDGTCSNYYNRPQPVADPLARRAVRATHPAALVWRRISCRKIGNFSLQAQDRLDRQWPAERDAALLPFPRAAWWFDLLHRRFANARPDRTR